jgi:uncharacterized membrane protein YphA (DoxX/SURF4 family)
MDAWPRWKLIAFRFGLVAIVLAMSLHAWVFVPSETVMGVVFDVWHTIATWLGALLGLEVPPLEPSGSGDQLVCYLQFLASLILAVIVTALWTWRSRARAYPRLADASLTALRVLLCTIMIRYGMAKLVPMQFPPLWLGRYDVPLGEMSPMGLLWTFMGHSPVYSTFAGAAEVVGAVLLLWRRTHVIGALILIAVMTNVVLLNLCYDVPVKLFSLQLLALLIVLVAPQARRLLGALLGYPAREMPPRIRGTFAAERVRRAIKIVVLVLIALHAYRCWAIGSGLSELRAPSVLQGTWRAERVVIDGVERAPLFTDDARWRRVIFHEYGLTIRYATDRREHARVHIDATEHTIAIDKGVLRQVWRYQRPDDDHLIIDTPRVHAELVREPAPLLKTRGFHWVQEAPYNR